MTITRLTTSESLALDAIRVGAAGTVAFCHLTQSPFSIGWHDRSDIARRAVAVFFLLSGFVIRYVTLRKPTTTRRFLGDRASRMYSVALPALLFTLFTFLIARALHPDFFAQHPGTYSHPALRIAANLAFCGQLWKFVLTPLSDGPFWSVNYEVAFYLMYACWFYLKGAKRWLSTFALAAFCGPLVLYLAPLWVLGCILHDVYQKWRTNDPTARGFTMLFAAGLAILITIFSGISHLVLYPAHRNANRLLRMAADSYLTPRDYRFGFCLPFAFLLALWLVRRITLREDTPFVRATRLAADATFPLYLLHYPVYIFLAVCVPYNHASTPQKLLIFAGVLTAALLVGHPCELFKNKLRSLKFPTFNAMVPIAKES